MLSFKCESLSAHLLLLHAKIELEAICNTDGLYTGLKINYSPSLYKYCSVRPYAEP